ncbi:virulence factor TspB C-terminal domain-related protein [Nitrosomonas sp.]|uniref:virulence factor TspB C-terminal domain-related protein n=1 Tax=Nitrosomonas sp. TaxID=42353 RepID=UPI0032EC465E
MAYLYHLIAFFLFFFPSFSFASVWAGPGSAPVGWIDLAGWIKHEDGTSTRAFADQNGTTARVTLTSAPKGITTTSTALVQTSKGITAMDIVKTANVNTARLGSSMVDLAKRAGPLGMTLTAVSLVCELTSICKDALGNWSITSNDDLPDYPSSTSSIGYYYVAGINTPPYRYPSAETACSSAASKDKFWGNGFTGSGSGTGPNACTVTKTSDGTTNKTSITFASFSCPEHYAVSGSACVLTGATPRTPNDADWSSKQDKLNDDRVTPHLIDAGAPVPVNPVPTLTPDQKKGLGLDSKPTMDSSGNVTGREDTTTEIEAVDAGTPENPGGVIIKETKTTVKYDNSNTQISSTTNTSYTNQPEPQQPQGFTISFDTVPEATLPTYNVPNTFGSTSWGSGSCPPNIDIPTSKMTITIPTEPVCDMAEMINPFVLLICSIISIYIVAGVRGGNAT